MQRTIHARIGRKRNVHARGGRNRIGCARRSTAGSAPEKIGRFQIRTKVGAGAFGAVYRAYDELLDREVALKVPHAGAMASSAEKARSLREPKAAAKLRHANIVSAL